MPGIPIQWRGDTAERHGEFTGLTREITVDTTNWTLVVHDGQTVGGHALAKKEHTHNASEISGLQYQIVQINGMAVAQRTHLNLDPCFAVTDDPESGATNISLADVGVDKATWGSKNTVPQITTDTKGRITGVVNVTIDALPAQNENNGRYLRTNGSGISWDQPITETTFKGLPAPDNNTAKVFLMSDGTTLCISDGLALHHYGLLSRVSPPVLSDFSLLNGLPETTMTTVAGTNILLDSGVAESAFIAGLTECKPVFTITAAFTAMLSHSVSGQQRAGICIKDVVSGKALSFGVTLNPANDKKYPSVKFIEGYKHLASYNGIEPSYDIPMIAPADLIWLQLKDNGSVRTLRYSTDGKVWMPLLQTPSNDVLVANQAGFFIQGDGARAAVKLSSWSLLM